MAGPPMPDDVREILRRAGESPETGLDLAETALALAALDRSGVALDRYRRHLADLGEAVGHAAEELGGGIAAAGGALGAVIAEGFGYVGDAETYEDVQNANLMRVIDRRKGLPVALGILYIHVARSQGWSMVGLNFPGHFLVRLEIDGERMILDPFHAGVERKTGEMRDLLKAVAGTGAELRPEHSAAVADRDILLRLQNNIKLRHLRADEVGRALDILEGMQLIAPREPLLWRESGLLNARLGNLGAAIDNLERFMVSGAPERLKDQTEPVLRQLRARLD